MNPRITKSINECIPLSQLRITAYYQNLRIYECNNQNSVIRGTLYETARVKHHLEC